MKGERKGSKSDRAKGDCAGEQGATDREDENLLAFYVSNYMKDGYNPANRPTDRTYTRLTSPSYPFRINQPTRVLPFQPPAESPLASVTHLFGSVLPVLSRPFLSRHILRGDANGKVGEREREVEKAGGEKESFLCFSLCIKCPAEDLTTPRRAS